MRFLRKLDKEDDFLILRGKSFYKRQIKYTDKTRILNEFLSY